MVETGSLRVLEILSTASGVIAEGEVLQLTTAHDLAHRRGALCPRHPRQDGGAVPGGDRGRRRHRRRRRDEGAGAGRLRPRARHGLPAFRRLSRLWRLVGGARQERRRRFPRGQGDAAGHPRARARRRRGAARSGSAPSGAASSGRAIWSRRWPIWPRRTRWRRRAGARGPRSTPRSRRSRPSRPRRCGRRWTTSRRSWSSAPSDTARARPARHLTDAWRLAPGSAWAAAPCPRRAPPRPTSGAGAAGRPARWPLPRPDHGKAGGARARHAGERRGGQRLQHFADCRAERHRRGLKVVALSCQPGDESLEAVEARFRRRRTGRRVAVAHAGEDGAGRHGQQRVDQHQPERRQARRGRQPLADALHPRRPWRGAADRHVGAERQGQPVRHRDSPQPRQQPKRRRRVARAAADARGQRQVLGQPERGPGGAPVA